MKNIIALGVAFLMSTAAVFAEDTKPALTPTMTRYRQVVLEKLRNSIIEFKGTMHFVVNGLSQEDIASYSSLIDQKAEDSFADNMNQTSAALDQMIVSLGGKSTKDTYTEDSPEMNKTLEDISKNLQDILQPAK